MAKHEDDYEYEITYSVRRRRVGPDEEEFTEIGFGASGAWSTPDQCTHAIGTDVQNYRWETTPGMPDPDDVRDQVQQSRSDG